MKMEQIESSETSAIINQTPGNYPKGNLLYSVHGESLKSRKLFLTCNTAFPQIILLHASEPCLKCINISLQWKF